MDKQKWFTARVIKGNKIGRIIGYPTINLDNPSILMGLKEGVYAAKIKINNNDYLGALFYGPRIILKETKSVLEIFLFDFEGEIYDQTISFSLQKYIRGVMDFPNFDSMKIQLEKDCRDIKRILIQ